eukprot:Nitzschia sp. Nitz4//scaffold9_size221794//57278//58819//NITZ4_001333-RA/size221794-processed-gene-0.10-mRNA-1//1//CDS//3329560962//1217//frame0
MLITQELFDETLVESQELFEYDDDQAVKETISELQSQQGENVHLDHLSLTHPNTEQGQKVRACQQHFIEAFSKEDLDSAAAVLDDLRELGVTSALPMVTSWMLQNRFLVDLSDKFTSQDAATLTRWIQFFTNILPEQASIHPLVRELQLQLGQPLQVCWYSLLEKYQGNADLQVVLMRFAFQCCNGCESNKKTLVQAGIRYKPAGESTAGIQLLSDTLHATLDTDTDKQMAKELCKLVAVLGRFQAAAEPRPEDGQEPVVSSAHANAKEFHKCGILHKLHDLVRCAMEIEEESVLCESLSSLRVMAIDNDIVQNMVAVGVLDLISTDQMENWLLLVRQAMTAAATLGLIRNLCANDEIKGTLCKHSLPSILQAMELHATNASVQENGCGILAAMALRQPNNAIRICQANGGEYIVKAMKAFPNKVTLQRQGCLALRNLASRSSPEHKQVLLDAGAEFVLRQIAGRHQESIDESYAALRDLGLPAVMYTIDENGKAQGTQMFGTVKSNFRPVYE